MNATDLPDPLHNLPYSARFVFNRLREHEPCTYHKLHEQVGMPESTFCAALKRLRDAGLVERQPDPRDGRRTTYRSLQ